MLYRLSPIWGRSDTQSEIDGNWYNFTSQYRKNLRSMDKAAIRSQIAAIEGKREFLVRLLERPDLGTLRIDVNQALEEMDDLIEEFRRTFPNGD
ncbi:hypothetical protein IQ235_09735 [Oscillatoriales cyanobacterium LEGE 11467]|uniref:Uncharacterized protein n=1 Tax=Zarconia navalis LEGE 11467 TaxID=1828826 RepID=A0A928VVE7_9CYAN|nr:hypothetical protein [Zarconia navalis]MBE9041059.1 hypothetical protein [Zarconia navalis LEGE 11467]